MRTPNTKRLCKLLGARVVSIYSSAAPGRAYVECAVGLDDENLFTGIHDTVAGLEQECRQILRSIESPQLQLVFEESAVWVD